MYTFMLCIKVFNDKKWQYIVLHVEIHNDHRAYLHQELYISVSYTQSLDLFCFYCLVYNNRAYITMEL